MTRRPFLLLATRAEDVVADDEYEAFLRFGELPESGLRRVRLEREELGDVALEDYAGIIVGGGPFCGSTPQEHKSDVQLRVEAELLPLLRQALVQDRPVLGVCYGVGTVGLAAGGEVDDTYAEPISAPLIHLTDEGRNDPIARVLPETFRAYVGHKEAMSKLPPHGATVLAESGSCPVQMVRVGQHAYLTQFHPEMNHATMTKRIETYRNSGYFAPEEVEALIAATGVYAHEVTACHAVIGSFVERYS